MERPAPLMIMPLVPSTPLLIRSIQAFNRWAHDKNACIHTADRVQSAYANGVTKFAVNLRQRTIATLVTIVRENDYPAVFYVPSDRKPDLENVLHEAWHATIRRILGDYESDDVETLLQDAEATLRTCFQLRLTPTMCNVAGTDSFIGASVASTSDEFQCLYDMTRSNTPFQRDQFEKTRHDLMVYETEDGPIVVKSICVWCANRSLDGVNSKLKTCGNCRSRRYCCVDCQRKHWNAGHKEECKRICADRESGLD